MARSHAAWHYPRALLARQIMDALDQGQANAFLLFKPRRSGKTDFLQNDLAPLARKRKWRAVYVSFWQSDAAPLVILEDALRRELAHGTLTGRLKSMTHEIKSAELIGAKLERHTARATDELLRLDALLADLCASKPTLLLLDEVQTLALKPANAGLLAALRTTLDKRADRLAAVFTGSSLYGLKQMFHDAKAPFFKFAETLPFPDLGDSFVDHMLAMFQRTTQRKPPARDEMLRIFNNFDRSPYYLRRVVNRMILESLTPAQAVKAISSEFAEDFRHKNAWLSLAPLDRALLAALARDEPKPFAAAAREQYGAQARETTPTIAQIQAILRRLARAEVVDNHTGKWAVSDPEYAHWIREEGRA